VGKITTRINSRGVTSGSAWMIIGFRYVKIFHGGESFKVKTA
jgi:hypothetical protein